MGSFVKHTLDFIKFRITVFVLIGASCSYLYGLPVGQSVDWNEFLFFLFFLSVFSSGIFALNQVQEASLDAKMPRTAHRILPRKKISTYQALVISIGLTLFGLLGLFIFNPLVGSLSLAVLILYNLFYTWLWKPHWIFAAVPGAIPGAMPPLIGFVAAGGNILSIEVIYLFLIMFLWQMPHFWYLSIHYKKDYLSGDIPVPPNLLGTKKTLYLMGIYTCVYLGLALSSPLFVHTSYFFLFLSLPMIIKLGYEFFKLFELEINSTSIENSKKRPFSPFFIWVNLSLLVFLTTPLLDKFLIFY